MNMLRSVYDWMGKQVHTSRAVPVLSFLFFIEATVFFIPVDPLLILYCIEHRKKAWYFATVGTISSVVGGIFGYYIGFGLWEIIGKKIVTLLINPVTFAGAVASFKKYESFAVFIAGFTPIPYKAVTIGAGFCRLPLAPFIFYSILARGARFYLLAGIITIWGARIKEYIDRYFNLFVILFVVLMFIGIYVIKISTGQS